MTPTRPGGVAGGARPDRCVIVYSQRAREAYRDVPVVIGGIEASLRRIAHFDYWSEKVRRSVLMDAKADLLVYGNAERQICEIAHRLAAGKRIEEIDDLRGTAFVRREAPNGWIEIDSTTIDTPGPVESAGRSVPMDWSRSRRPAGDLSSPRRERVETVFTSPCDSGRGRATARVRACTSLNVQPQGGEARTARTA